MLGLVVLAAAASALLSVPLASAILGVGVAEAARGVWRTVRTTRSAVVAAVSTPAS
jgi:hypothetical protein